MDQIIFYLVLLQVDEGDPPFPRPAGSWWFGCHNKNLQLRQSDNDDVGREILDDDLDDSSEILDAGIDNKII